MSHEFLTASLSGSTDCIQMVTSSPTNSSTLNYGPYVSPVIPADAIISPVNSNVVYTPVQVSSPLVNTVPYSIFCATPPPTTNVYNFVATGAHYNYEGNYSVLQVASSADNEPNSSLLNCSGSESGSILNCTGSVDRYSIVGYNCSPPTKPCGRNNKAGWYDIHARHTSMVARKRAYVILCGDSIIAGLTRYSGVWCKYFRPLNAINCGIGGDRTQHLLWRMENMELPVSVKYVVLHCGTNNIDQDPPHEIANGIVSCGLVLQEKVPTLNIVITGLLPRDLQNSGRRSKIIETNKCIKKYCQQFPNFTYMRQDNDWVLENGLLNEPLYYQDHLHLNENGNHKFAASISSIIDRLNKNENIVYSSDETDVEVESTSNQFEMKHGEVREDETLEGEDSVYETPVKTKKKRKRHLSLESPEKKRLKTHRDIHETEEDLNKEEYIHKHTTPKKLKHSQNLLISEESPPPSQNLLMCEERPPPSQNILMCEERPHPSQNLLICKESSPLVKEFNHVTEEPKSLNINEVEHSNVSLSDSSKSINILSAETDAQEVGRNKVGCNLVKNHSKVSKKGGALVGKISKISAPSALVQRIKRSMLQAREELSKKKLGISSASSLLGGGSTAESEDSSAQNIKLKKILPDYDSGSE